MREIPLTQNKIAIIDDSDYPLVSRHKWYAIFDGWNWYAGRKFNKRQQRMHNFLMRPPISVVIDHRDGNGLNNQRRNLRICTRSENLHRMREKQPHSSRFKGVSWVKKNQKWRAQIRGNFSVVYLGLYEDEREAALRYDGAAMEYFGEHALTNKALGLL